MSEEELTVLEEQYVAHKNSTPVRNGYGIPITPDEEKIAELWRSSKLNLNAFSKALGITRDRVSTILLRVDRARHQAKQQNT